MNERNASAAVRVLVVDRDADELALLASSLRARGLAVVLANGPRMACERAATGGFDVIVVPSELEDTDEGTSAIETVASVLGTSLPTVVLVRDPEAAWGENTVLRGDIDALVNRIHALSSRSVDATRPPLPVHQAESLLQGSVREVTQRLHEERRTGSLAITTARGEGELRFSRGELVDAVYVRTEGVKALLRLLGETDAACVFTPGMPTVMRRLTMATDDLLREAGRQVDDARRMRVVLGEGDASAFVAVNGGDTSSHRASAAALLVRMRVAKTLDEILDDAPEPDVEVLENLLEFEASGRLRRVPAHNRRLPFVAGEQIERVRALAARARAAGFDGPARIVLAGVAARLAVLAQAALSLEEAVAPSEPHFSIPAPYEIATLRFGEGLALELYAVPLVPAYSPTWPMFLAGAAVVVRLDEAAGDLLEQACQAVALQAVDGRELVARIDDANVEDVASLVRAALDAA